MESGSYEYGDLFEQFIILEMHRLNSYFSLDYQFSYLQTNNNLEVDIIIERPGKPTAFVEIKSSSEVKQADFASLKNLKIDYPKNEYFCLSNDAHERTESGIQILNWKKGLKELGFSI